MDPRKLHLWDAFCGSHRIAECSVPLFATRDGLHVETFPYGRDNRSMLRRSPAMEALLAGAVQTCVDAPSDALEGVLYMMLRLTPSGVIEPLYVGRAGKVGRNGGVSANIASITSNAGKFARWGYNYAYHIGDLSAATLPGHARSKSAPKYENWAQTLFDEAPTANPRLRGDVRFWCTPWGPGSTSIWPEFGACSLSFIEYLVIGVGSLLFPHTLLNREGVNSSSRPTDGGLED